jgi:hypothetical protein
MVFTEETHRAFIFALEDSGKIETGSTPSFTIAEVVASRFGAEISA